MSTTKTIVRKARELSTRSLFDVSSKVKAAAIAAAGTDLGALGAYLGGTISAHALIGFAIASAVPVVAAYAKTSSEEVLEAAEEAATIARETGTIVKAVVPASSPVVDVVEDSVAAVSAMLAEPAPVPEVPATTETIALSAPRPATAGGQ